MTSPLFNVAMFLIGMGVLILLFHQTSDKDGASQKDVKIVERNENKNIQINNRNNNGPVSPRMRSIFESQAEKRRAAMKNILLRSETDFLTFYNAIVSEVFCAELVRIGTISDGGKWMCSPFNLPSGCNILSLGLANSISFELDLQKLTDQRCKVIGVDMNDQSSSTRALMEKHNGKAITGTIGEGARQLSLAKLLETNGMSKVEILKIDIEGAEYTALLPFLDKFVVAQILIEVHPNNSAFKMVELLNQLSKRGYWIANYEINGRYHQLSEYTLVHESAFQTYSATPLARYMLF